MNSLGETLRAAREQKGMTIDAIARETNIARKYLAALEAEDFAQFPAEAYVTGFLKNYADILSLDSAELLSIYKVIKLQEQPIPMKELLTRAPRRNLFVIIALIVVVIGGIGTGLYFLLWNKKDTALVDAGVKGPTSYILEEGVLEQRFHSGDAVTVRGGAELYKFTLTNLGDAVTISGPNGNLILDLSRTISVDVNNDGIDELDISLEDYARNEPLMGAWIRFNLKNADLVTSGDSRSAATGATSSAAVVVGTPKVILTGQNPYPFTLETVFQGYCMFRWEILREAGRQNRNEQYFSRGGELNIQAQNGVRLWVSNAAAVKIEAIGGGRTQSVELGAAGEVVVADIAWSRDDSGGWKLALERLE
jgi:cytoskeletal protein RodZ